MIDEKFLGGDFDDFLRKEGIIDEAEAVAAKRVIAFQISEEMKRFNRAPRKITNSQKPYGCKKSRLRGGESK